MGKLTAILTAAASVVVVGCADQPASDDAYPNH